MTAPESTDLPFHERLQRAVRKTWPDADFTAQCRHLRTALLDGGAHPHHAAQLTIQRWLTGRGIPPPECQAIFAETLGVSYRWLRDGEGVLPKGKAQPVARPPADARPKRAAQPGTRPQTVPSEPPLPEGPETEVSVPNAEDVHETSSRVILDFLANVQSTVAVQAILEHEPSHPKYEGGRKTVLRAAEARLNALTSA